MKGTKPVPAIAKNKGTESNVKKIPKEPPITRSNNVDEEVRSLIGLDVDAMNAEQKKSYDAFMVAFRSLEYNPFSERALTIHHHGIPATPQFTQMLVEKSTEKMKNNTTTTSNSFVAMVRDMHHELLSKYDTAVAETQKHPHVVAMQQNAVKFDDPRFQAFFEANMEYLKQKQIFLPKCNDMLCELLNKFRTKNPTASFVPQNQIPVLQPSNNTLPSPISRLSYINQCYSVQMIEMLLRSMTSEDMGDALIRDKRCCMRGDQCQGRMLFNKFDIHSTSSVPDIIMYRMRPYDMLAANTWEGENPFIDCFFCVHTLFWDATLDNLTASRPQSVIHSTLFVRMADGDPTAFPRHLCVTAEHPWLKNVANVAHPILISNIADHFSYSDGGFHFNGSRFQ